MDNYYVRLWNEAGTRVFGWLGNIGGYAGCIPAGLYENPLTGDACVAQWRSDGNPGKGFLAIPDADGDLGLAGASTGGNTAYWRAIGDAYPLAMTSDPARKLESPVPGAFSGTLARAEDGFSLHAYFNAHRNSFGLEYEEVAKPLGEIFSDDDIKLDFETQKLVFEFVPAMSFNTGQSHVPGLGDREHIWQATKLNSWMGDMLKIIGNRPLADLVIPGSHDSTSWSFQLVGADQRSRTQSREIYGQLCAGARYLDLRFQHYASGKWWGYHGSDENDAELTAVLADINRFLDENVNEVLIILSLPYGTDAQMKSYWDILLNAFQGRVYPRCVTAPDGHEDERFIRNVSPFPLAHGGQRILLFSWGLPPTGTVADGPMAGAQRHQYVWYATPEDPKVSDGSRPWQAEADIARAAGYELAFDSNGLWLDSKDTTAHDLRLMTDAVDPPGGGALWMLHSNAPARPGGESIETKAARIEPPFAKFVQEDPTMTAKLNLVNMDFVGDHLALSWALIQQNLRR